MKQRASDYNTKLYFVQLLEEFGSFEYTRKKLEELKNETLKEIKRIGLRDNEFVVRIFDEALNSLETEIYCEQKKIEIINMNKRKASKIKKINCNTMFTCATLNK